MTIYITRKFPGNGINLLAHAGHKVLINESNKPLSNKELLANVSGEDINAILSMLTDQISTEVFDAAPNLKVVANYAVGFDNIDISEAKKRGIVITNTPDILTNAVAEHTVALMFALARRVTEADRLVRRGLWNGWDPALMLGTELSGKALGLIGAGRIGSQVARSASKGHGMNIIYFDKRQNASLESETGAIFTSNVSELVSKADVVSLHLPLTQETRYIIDSKKLSLMKKTAFLLNTSRGAVVDEEALTKALKENLIAGAALDVFENEPHVTPGLLTLSNVILTPHIASATVEARGKMGELAAQSIIDVLAGMTPLNAIS